MSKTFKIIALIAALVLVIGIVVIVYALSNEKKSAETIILESKTEPQAETSQNKTEVEVVQPNGDETEDMEEYDFMGLLSDVTNGPIRNTDFDGNASGEAKAIFVEGTYMLNATFENLPEPKGGDFYEGWVVRTTPFNFVSTGALDKENGKYVNNFKADEDLTDHTQYVLTIEPDDGDPAPAEHVVEGFMEAK